MLYTTYFIKSSSENKLCTENNCHAFQNMDLTLSQKNTLKIQEKNQGYNSQLWVRFFLTNLSLTCYRLLIFPKWKGGYLFITYINVSKNASTILQNKCRKKILAFAVLNFFSQLFFWEFLMNRFWQYFLEIHLNVLYQQNMVKFHEHVHQTCIAA